ncbi:MAG: tetratricopeptide repeat protein [Verrucomicrobiota bacterium]
MKPPSSDFPATPGWRSGLNAVLMIAGLSISLVFLSNRPTGALPPSAAATSAGGVELQVSSMLEALSTPASRALYGKTMASAVEKVRRLPDSAQAWVALGDVIAQGQRDTSDPACFGHAGIAYQRALKLQASHTGAMAGMAWVHGGRHEFDLSKLWAGKALALDPGNAASHGIIGDAAVELGDYDEAFLHYQKMMDLRPDLSSWSRGAHLLWLTGKQSRAVLLMEQAVQSGGPYAENTAWCRARLAMMLFHDGALLPAAQALAPALAAGSANPHVRLAAGRIAAAGADFETAAMHYQKVLESAGNLEALIALGDIFAVRGDTFSAEKYYAEVEALHRSHRETGIHDHMEMARFYADHDRQLPEALKLIQEHGQSGNPMEADTSAWVYFKNGDQIKAIECIKTALKKARPDAELHYHAGRIAAAAGDRVSAEKHFQQALGRNPNFSLIQAPFASRALAELKTSAPVPLVVPAVVPVQFSNTRLR